MHGGTSGIGTTAIMLAKAFGARVITTAGSDDKCAAAKKLGADVAVNYKTEDFVAATKTATGRQGRRTSSSTSSAATTSSATTPLPPIRASSPRCRSAGPKATANFGLLMQKRLHHTGSTLRPRTVAEKAAIARGIEERVWPLVAAGKIKPVINSTYPMAKAAKPRPAWKRASTSARSC